MEHPKRSYIRVSNGKVYLVIVNSVTQRAQNVYTVDQVVVVGNKTQITCGSHKYRIPSNRMVEFDNASPADLFKVFK